ncbi:MAG: hypothetical protein U0002_11030 [Thermoanaerobaculia bacterium]
MKLRSTTRWIALALLSLLAAPPAWSAGCLPTSSLPVKGDFDGDGCSDIFAFYLSASGRPSGRNVVWGVNGSTATPINFSALVSEIGDWRPSAVLDFDGGGFQGLLWSHPSGVYAVSGFDGEKLLSPIFPEPGVTLTSFRDIGTGDFTGDGLDDVLAWDSTNGDLVVRVMSGSVVTQELRTEPAGQPNLAWVPVAVGRVDQLGTVDIVWENQFTRQLQVWYMSGTSRTATGGFSPAAPNDSNWHVVGFGDFDGDGWNDILYQNTTTRRLVIWFLQGASRRFGEYLKPDLLDLLFGGVSWPWQVVGPR